MYLNAFQRKYAYEGHIYYIIIVEICSLVKTYMTLLQNLPLVSLFEIPIHAITMPQALDVIHRSITDRVPLQVGVVNAAKIVNMHSDPDLMRDVLSSDMILADGAAVVWASKILGQPLPERVAGIDLMYGMFERGVRHGYRVYCLGATEEISVRVAEVIRKHYPGVILAGRHHGYYTAEQEQEIAEDIARSNADILLVAMTSPKKEHFLARWSDIIKTPVCHGVGGSFDVMAGKVARAPALWQKMGLEWLYRVLQEPRRLWRRYLVTNTLFCLMVFKALFGRGGRHS